MGGQRRLVSNWVSTLRVLLIYFLFLTDKRACQNVHALQWPPVVECMRRRAPLFSALYPTSPFSSSHSFGLITETINALTSRMRRAETRIQGIISVSHLLPLTSGTSRGTSAIPSDRSQWFFSMAHFLLLVLQHCFWHTIGVPFASFSCATSTLSGFHVIQREAMRAV
jgi:hypothetical protein